MARYVLLALGVLLVAYVAKVVFTPASWPKSTLRAWLVQRVPYGSSEEQVRKFLATRRFGTTWSATHDSFSRSHGIKFSEGTHTIQALMGDYRQPLSLFLFETSTEAFFGFDANNRLVDIRVRKTTDAP